jgi:hypothetical protein
MVEESAWVLREDLPYRDLIEGIPRRWLRRENDRVKIVCKTFQKPLASTQSPLLQELAQVRPGYPSVQVFSARLTRRSLRPSSGNARSLFPEAPQGTQVCHTGDFHESIPQAAAALRLLS